MEKIVTKRDGRRVAFDKNKIVHAIELACADVDGRCTEESLALAEKIATEIESNKTESMSVEEIQDMVESRLMRSARKDVAKTYILYRDKRTRERERNSRLTKIVGEKLNASNVQNQNANIDEQSFGGRMGEASSEILKQYALDYCVSDMAKNNHLNNEIYIHDLNSYALGNHNCLSLPFDDLLKNGFNTRQTDIRPAQSVSTAFQLVAVLFQLQSLQQFGGVAATHLDWTMVPYVRKSFAKHFKDGMRYIENASTHDIGEELSFEEPFVNLACNTRVREYAMDMTVKETYQAVEGLYHNLSY